MIALCGGTEGIGSVVVEVGLAIKEGIMEGTVVTEALQEQATEGTEETAEAPHGHLWKRERVHPNGNHNVVRWRNHRNVAQSPLLHEGEGPCLKGGPCAKRHIVVHCICPQLLQSPVLLNLDDPFHRLILVCVDIEVVRVLDSHCVLWRRGYLVYREIWGSIFFNITFRPTLLNMRISHECQNRIKIAITFQRRFSCIIFHNPY